ncbi:hypothetical protein ATKI12_5531 [Kitasatospora sp. Ki12]
MANQELWPVPAWIAQRPDGRATVAITVGEEAGRACPARTVTSPGPGKGRTMFDSGWR